MVETDAQAVTQTATQAPIPPRQGEPCEECGAPLAADQRYCLNCGRRRSGPRVDYRHYMGSAASSAEPAAPELRQSPPAEEPAKTQRDYAPLAAVGGIAVLGVMLLIGVLIGKGNNTTASTPPTQVVRLPAGTGEESGSEGGGSSKNTGGALGGGSSAKKAKHSGNGGDSTDTGSAVKASEGDLEELSGESGESYEKQSKNLPNEIATPGAPPPIDKSKPPGGGEGGGEVIK